MGDRTKIEWTDASWNPIIGCSKCSPGCANCYAEKMAYRLACMEHRESGVGFTFGPYTSVLGLGGRWNGKTVFVESQLSKPLHWKKPRRVFVCSMGDLFHETVPFEWVDKVIGVIGSRKQHTFQILTKRPARMKDYFCGLATDPQQATRLATSGCCMDHKHSVAMKYRRGGALENLWLGTTVCTQDEADKKIPVLLKTPAAKRFVSVEPMLEAVDLTKIKWAKISTEGWKHLPLGVPIPDECWSLNNVLESRLADKLNSGKVGLDWVICGCESLSGGKAGIGMFDDEAAWWAAAERLYQQCADAGVPFFFKQGPVNGKVVKAAKAPEKLPAWARTQETLE